MRFSIAVVFTLLFIYANAQQAAKDTASKLQESHKANVIQPDAAMGFSDVIATVYDPCVESFTVGKHTQCLAGLFFLKPGGDTVWTTHLFNYPLSEYLIAGDKIKVQYDWSGDYADIIPADSFPFFTPDSSTVTVKGTVLEIFYNSRTIVFSYPVPANPAIGLQHDTVLERAIATTNDKLWNDPLWARFPNLLAGNSYEVYFPPGNPWQGVINLHRPWKDAPVIKAGKNSISISAFPISKIHMNYSHVIGKSLTAGFSGTYNYGGSYSADFNLHFFFRPHAPWGYYCAFFIGGYHATNLEAFYGDVSIFGTGQPSTNFKDSLIDMLRYYPGDVIVQHYSFWTFGFGGGLGAQWCLDSRERLMLGFETGGQYADLPLYVTEGRDEGGRTYRLVGMPGWKTFASVAYPGYLKFSIGYRF